MINRQVFLLTLRKKEKLLTDLYLLGRKKEQRIQRQKKNKETDVERKKKRVRWLKREWSKIRKNNKKKDI